MQWTTLLMCCDLVQLRASVGICRGLCACMSMSIFYLTNGDERSARQRVACARKKEPTERTQRKHILWENDDTRRRRERERTEFLFYAVGRMEKNICSVAGSQNAFQYVFFLCDFWRKKLMQSLRNAEMLWCVRFRFGQSTVNPSPSVSAAKYKWKWNLSECCAIAVLNALGIFSISLSCWSKWTN